MDLHANYTRVIRAIIEVLTVILRDIVLQHIPAVDVAFRINSVKHRLPTLSADQLVTVKNTARDKSYDKYDISLLYIILR